MYRSFFEGHALLAFPLIALVFFVVFFLVAVRRAMRHPVQKIDELAAMPLADDTSLRAARTAEATNGAAHE